MSFAICLEHASESYQECAEYADKGTNQCNQYRDDGYNACSQYRDDGYNACAEFKRNCCTWWPCNWFCEIVSWFCVAWYWVSNVVCVAWYWVSNVVCVAWYWVSNVVCVVFVWIAALVCIVWTTINVISCLLWSVVEILLILVAIILNWVFSWPVIGRLLKNIWGLATDIGARILSIPDAILAGLGIKKSKKIRLNVLILRNERGSPVINQGDFDTEFKKSRDILKREANINLYIEKITIMKENGYPEILDVGCNEAAFLQDLLFTGSGYEGLASSYFSISGGSRLLGINPPIIVFIVRDFMEGVTHLNLAGCSLFSNTDYITISGRSINISAKSPGSEGGICDGTLAHEIGHKCGLLHVKDNQDNLMWSNEDKPLLGACSNLNTMYTSQVAWVRMSKYVTS